MLNGLPAWSWHLPTILLLGGGFIFYLLGWRRLRARGSGLGHVGRLASFVVGIAVVIIAMLSPVQAWADLFLAARSLQLVLICMFAPPLLWLAAPVHIVLLGLPFPLRRRLSPMLRSKSWPARAISRITQPAIAWLIFVSAFLLWHDPTVTEWTVQSAWFQRTLLWIVLAAAFLYWSHIVGTGPRIHPLLPAWVGLAYLLTVEIPNMAAGITIAFTAEPIYPHYVAAQAALRAAGITPPLTVMEDQMVGGALVWVTGSFVYIFSMIMVLNRLFVREGSEYPQAYQNWDAAENLIAPGLEHRVRSRRDLPK